MRSFKEYWDEHGDVYAMEIAEDAWDYQQAKIDELQKRVDAALKLIPSLKSENDLWGCEQVERQIELLKQALKGGDQ